MTYLGLPLCDNRIPKKYWSDFCDNITSKLCKWKDNVLSYGGRIFVVKFTIQTLGFHIIAAIKIPTWALNKLNAFCMNFLWRGYAMNSKDINLISWSKLCLLKDLGSAGFLNLKIMNITLIVKHYWKFISGQKVMDIHHTRKLLQQKMAELLHRLSIVF